MMPQDSVCVGIDVSKAELVLSEQGGRGTFAVANTARGWAGLIRRWKGRRVIIGVEPSGGYEQGVVRALVAAGLDVRWADPRRVRALAEAMGAPAKTDPLDAEMIGLYVRQTGGSPIELHPEREALRDLLTARTAVQDSAQRLRRQAEALGEGPARQALERAAEVCEAEVKALHRQALAALAQDEALERDGRIMQTLPGIGPLAAAELLATMPELGRLSGKAIARLTGLAPYIRKSGAWTGKALCSGGRPRPRRILYLAAMASIRAKNGLRPVYDTLIAKGKPRMVALVACMRRIIVTLNAMIASQTPYKPNTA
jgi:transposase